MIKPTWEQKLFDINQGATPVEKVGDKKQTQSERTERKEKRWLTFEEATQQLKKKFGLTDNEVNRFIIFLRRNIKLTSKQITGEWKINITDKDTANLTKRGERNKHRMFQISKTTPTMVLNKGLLPPGFKASSPDELKPFMVPTQEISFQEVLTEWTRTESGKMGRVADKLDLEHIEKNLK